MNNTFRKKKVLVTGHTGFKGSWLSVWLHMLGAEVIGYALPPIQEISHFSLLGLDKIMHNVYGDIRDFDQLNVVFSKYNPDFVFHLAAQPLVRESYRNPKITFDTNIGGTINVLEAVRTHPSVKSLICVTSDKCYKNKEWIWGYRENDDLGGPDPYSASKASAEFVFGAFLDSFFSRRNNLGAATVRAGNVIGGGDWSQERIVPDCIKAISEKREIVLRNPNATRPWQHVLEPLSGYLLLAKKLYENPSTFQGSWNFGPDGREVNTVGDLAQSIVTYWGNGSVRCIIEQDAPHEAGLLQLNCEKARQQLKWKQRWNFERTVKKTVEWYKGSILGKRVFDLTVGQINEYMEDE